MLRYSCSYVHASLLTDTMFAQKFSPKRRNQSLASTNFYTQRLQLFTLIIYIDVLDFSDIIVQPRYTVIHNGGNHCRKESYDDFVGVAVIGHWTPPLRGFMHMLERILAL